MPTVGFYFDIIL